MGVEFPSLGIANMLSIYVDDTLVIIKAEIYAVRLGHEKNPGSLRCSLGPTLYLGEDLGGSYTGGPPPSAFWTLQWTWEVNANATKLLGIPTVKGFSTTLMEEKVHTKVTTSICKLEKCHFISGGTGACS